jgi:3-oxoacyl-[acyl-carrier-protein] synthase II
MKPIAITGAGVAGPTGISAGAFWDALLQPQDRRAPWPKRAMSAYPVDNVIPIPESDWTALPAAATRADALAAYTVSQALAQAGLPGGARTGCFLATTTAGVEQLENEFIGEGAGGPAAALDAASVLQAPDRQWEGPVAMLSTACSSGLMAPALAIDALLAGEADAMVAGGLDVLLEYTICGFNGLRLATSEQCRPFDAARKGVVLSEGAVSFCLEPLEAAQARGAPVLAVIRGRGISCDAEHVTAPDPGGVSRAMKEALRESGVARQDIGAVFTHSTGTSVNDATEIQALRAAFGDAPLPPVTGIKAVMGHPQAAAGAFSLLAAVMALQTRHLPPTAWLAAADPAFGEITVSSGAGLALRTDHVLVEAFGFGGNNCVLVLSGPPAAGAQA